MTTKLIFIFILLATIASCDHFEQNKLSSKIDTCKGNQYSLTNNTSDNSEIVEIICDTIYKDKRISIRLVPIDDKTSNEPENTYIFRVFKKQNGKQTEIFRDTIESTVLEVKFADFNNDNVKDILIQNFSDARSNWTYNLYIVDKNVDLIRKIKGFEEIKNPNYLPKYDLIINMVASGRNWTSFYKIAGDTIKDFNIVIYNGNYENNKDIYDPDYKKAIKQILTNEKNNL